MVNVSIRKHHCSQLQRELQKESGQQKNKKDKNRWKIFLKMELEASILPWGVHPEYHLSLGSVIREIRNLQLNPLPLWLGFHAHGLIVLWVLYPKVYKILHRLLSQRCLCFSAGLLLADIAELLNHIPKEQLCSLPKVFFPFQSTQFSERVQAFNLFVFDIYF